MKITLKVLGQKKTIEADVHDEIEFEISNDDDSTALDINIHGDEHNYIMGSWIDLSVNVGSFDISEGDNTVVVEAEHEDRS